MMKTKFKKIYSFDIGENRKDLSLRGHRWRAFIPKSMLHRINTYATWDDGEIEVVLEAGVPMYRLTTIDRYDRKEVCLTTTDVAVGRVVTLTVISGSWDSTWGVPLEKYTRVLDEAKRIVQLLVEDQGWVELTPDLLKEAVGH